MGRLVLLVMLALSVACQGRAATADGREPAVERQEIAITLMPSDHLLAGESTITFAPGTRRVALRLAPSARIESVSIAGTRAPFSFSEGILSMDIPASAGREAIPVKVAYRAAFNDPLPQNSGSSEDPTYGVNGTITEQGTFLGDGAGWYPAPAALPRKRYIRVSAPAGTEAVTVGRRVSRETEGDVSRSAWEEEHPVDGLTLCAGPYRIAEKRVGGLVIYTYFYPDNAALAPRYLDAAAKYLGFYIDLFGPYPFEKFAVVENFFPTGYGLPSFTLLGGAIIRLPFIIDTSFPHEIAHSWWGNGVQVDLSEGNWSEGLVTYLADYLLKERRSAAEGRDYRMQILADYAALVLPENDFPLTAFTSRVDPASRAIGYGKAAMVFHMIRMEIGDRAFFAALREVCRERLYRSATWSDFERAFSRSSGRDLSAFMKQWLTRTGGPQPALSNVTRRRERQGWTVSGTIAQPPPFYALHLPLRLETAGQPVRETLAVARQESPFNIQSQAEPRQLLLDPDADVFRILAKSEIPVNVNSIKGSKHLIAVMTGDCRATEGTFRRLLESLGHGEAQIVQEGKFDAKRAQGQDLMFCGMPKERSMLPPFPAGISVNNDRFSVDKETVAAPDGTLFLVLPSAVSPGRVAALFQPFSEAAAELYTPKITHYGKYGSLAFTGGAIRYKGTIAPPLPPEVSKQF